MSIMSYELRIDKVMKDGTKVKTLITQEILNQIQNNEMLLFKILEKLGIDLDKEVYPLSNYSSQANIMRFLNYSKFLFFKQHPEKYLELEGRLGYSVR